MPDSHYVVMHSKYFLYRLVVGIFVLRAAIILRRCSMSWMRMAKREQPENKGEKTRRDTHYGITKNDHPIDFNYAKGK